jgi:hypothetical protein
MRALHAAVQLLLPSCLLGHGELSMGIRAQLFLLPCAPRCAAAAIVEQRQHSVLASIADSAVASNACDGCDTADDAALLPPALGSDSRCRVAPRRPPPLRAVATSVWQGYDTDGTPAALTASVESKPQPDLDRGGSERHLTTPVGTFVPVTLPWAAPAWQWEADRRQATREAVGAACFLTML